MNTPFFIRKASPADSAGLSQCMRSAYAEFATRLLGQRLPPVDADYAAEIAQYPTWVVESGGDIVGGLIMVLSASDASIANIAVDPSHRGKGIGRALMEFAESHAWDNGYCVLNLATHALLTENVSLYEHLGWQETGRDTTRVYMQKNLAQPTGS